MTYSIFSLIVPESYHYATEVCVFVCVYALFIYFSKDLTQSGSQKERVKWRNIDIERKGDKKKEAKKERHHINH